MENTMVSPQGEWVVRRADGLRDFRSMEKTTASPRFGDWADRQAFVLRRLGKERLK